MTWVRLGSLAELPIDGGQRVELSDDEAVALIRTEDGGVYALVDCCTHEDYPLSEGFVEEGKLECVLHGSRFDLATGHPDVPPAVAPVRTFPVKVDGDDVLVELPERWAELAEDL